MNRFPLIVRCSFVAGMAAIVATASIGCSSASDGTGAAAAEPGGEGNEAEAVATQEEIRASCSNPREYFATFLEGSGTCAPIPARNGQWLPEKLFADAPDDVQATTCAYRWSGAKYSRPDRDAIAAKVGYENGLAPACGASSTPDVGLLQPIPDIDIFAQVGSVGCDVCGVIRRGKMWVVLPERVAQKQFQVRLDNGQTLSFQIAATAARALSLTLPPPPPGTRYESGRVRIY